MSLTSLLKNRDVKDKFRKEFMKPPFTINKDLLSSPLTKNYALVGTAFDYVLRFYVKYLNPNAITKKWVAENSINILRENYRKNENFKSDFVIAKSLVSLAKKQYNSFLKTGEINDELLRSALFLSELDSIYRAGYIPRQFGTFDDKDIEDLKNLISIIDPDLFKAKNICLLNPTFGEASSLVGGADADLIIDDMLIEIKTTKNFQLDRDYFNQLIGYFTLYKISGVDGMPPENVIKKLGIYFSRHSYLHLYNVRDIINENNFSDFVEWFKERAITEKKYLII